MKVGESYVKLPNWNLARWPVAVKSIKALSFITSDDHGLEIDITKAFGIPSPKNSSAVVR